MGGILLWVSGGSTAYYIRNTGMPVGVLFLLWLMIYGLTGIVMACILLTGCSCGGNGGVPAAMCGGAYVLMLCWYAVYCCTRLVLFSGILLVLSILMLGAIFVIIGRGMILVRAAILLAETGQILCLIYCFFMNLLI